MKTAELTGAALDWAVANCVSKLNGLGGYVEEFIVHPFSTDWAQGGPIIEREKIGIDWETYDTGDIADGIWVAGIHTPPQGMYIMEDFSPLIAAMRCYVASKLGDDVDIPKELL